MHKRALIVLGAVACLATLPPFLLLVDSLLFPSPRSLNFGYWLCWSISGAVMGVLAGAALPFLSSRWWALLIVPALVDGWLALQLVIGMGVAAMH